MGPPPCILRSGPCGSGDALVQDRVRAWLGPFPPGLREPRCFQGVFKTIRLAGVRSGVHGNCPGSHRQAPWNHSVSGAATDTTAATENNSPRIVLVLYLMSINLSATLLQAESMHEIALDGSASKA